MVNQKGFTLLEILGVMILMAILISIGVTKLISVDKVAEETALKVATVELNQLELNCWTQIKIADDSNSWRDDEQVFDSCNYEIRNYEWLALNRDGGTLRFEGSSVELSRRHSAKHEPAKWYVEGGEIVKQ